MHHMAEHGRVVACSCHGYALANRWNAHLSGPPQRQTERKYACCSESCQSFVAQCVRPTVDHTHSSLSSLGSATLQGLLAVCTLCFGCSESITVPRLCYCACCLRGVTLSSADDSTTSVAFPSACAEHVQHQAQTTKSPRRNPRSFYLSSFCRSCGRWAWRSLSSRLLLGSFGVI